MYNRFVELSVVFIVVFPNRPAMSIKTNSHSIIDSNKTSYDWVRGHVVNARVTRHKIIVFESKPIANTPSKQRTSAIIKIVTCSCASLVFESLCQRQPTDNSQQFGLHLLDDLGVIIPVSILARFLFLHQKMPPRVRWHIEWPHIETNRPE